MRRARFFFAFENEAQIYRRRNAIRTHRIKCRSRGDDRRLIVTRGTGIEARFRIEGFRVLPVDLLAIRITHYRFPRIAFPL